MSRAEKAWLVATGGLVGTQVLAAMWLPRGFLLTAISDTAQAVLLACAMFAMVPNARAARGRIRIFWAMLAVGVGSWLLYQLSWTYFEIYLRQDVPDLFVGDIVLFLHLVPMMAALALQPHEQQDGRSVRLGSLDLALLFVWWIYLYVFTVLPWQYASPNVAFYDHNLNTIYLAEKIVCLGALTLLLTRSSGRWRAIYAHLFGASLTYSLASYFANWAISRKLYYTGSLYDVPLIVSMAWFVGIALLGRSAPPQQAPRRASNHGVWVARLGMLTTFSLPLFAAWVLTDRYVPIEVQSFRMLLTLATMLIMGIMIFLKQHLLDRELLSLLKSSQTSFENLKRLQAQLVQSEKLASLGQLLGGAAHELNNPLTAMLGYTDLLASSKLESEQRQLADKIAQQVRRTTALVSSLLSFAKQVPGQKTPLDLSVLTQTAIKLCQPQLRARNIDLHSELAPDLPLVLGDSNQLLQVCLHILNNSLHALEDSGHGVVTVSTRRQGNDVVLQFCDNGPGATEPERIFDPFYTTRPVGKGVGLGLSACYGIVQEHKGLILCENRSEGGALFQIKIPAMTTTAADARPSGAKKAAAVSKSHFQA